MQNAHRWFFYAGLVFNVILTADAIEVRSAPGHRIDRDHRSAPLWLLRWYWLALFVVQPFVSVLCVTGSKLLQAPHPAKLWKMSHAARRRHT